MQGIPMNVVRQLRNATSKQLIAAGGIASNEQIDELDALQIDAVVGMAIYTGKIKLLSPTSRPSLAAGKE
jgi:phosphoribosylformimino-5-aminoimidazole carboxamide ribotide isomerase